MCPPQGKDLEGHQQVRYCEDFNCGAWWVHLWEERPPHGRMPSGPTFPAGTDHHTYILSLSHAGLANADETQSQTIHLTGTRPKHEYE